MTRPAMAAKAKAPKATKPKATKKARGATLASKRIEPVLAFRTTGTQLVFRVFSGGCTETEHFHLDVRRRNGQAEVTLTRIVPDNCKGDFPDGTEIRFSYAKIDLDRNDVIRLRNPVGQPG
jgi:hypothetical protein